MGGFRLLAFFCLISCMPCGLDCHAYRSLRICKLTNLLFCWPDFDFGVSCTRQMFICAKSTRLWLNDWPERYLKAPKDIYKSDLYLGCGLGIHDFLVEMCHDQIGGKRQYDFCYFCFIILFVLADLYIIGKETNRDVSFLRKS